MAQAVFHALIFLNFYGLRIKPTYSQPTKHVNKIIVSNFLTMKVTINDTQGKTINCFENSNE